MKSFLIAILISLVTGNVYAQQVEFYCDKEVTKSGDTISTTSTCSSFYNPIIQSRDTVYTDEFGNDSLTILPLKIICRAINGNGNYKVFSALNKPYLVCNLKRNKFHGDCIGYYLNSNNIAAKAKLKKGRLNGFSYRYTPNGNIWLKDLYWRGKHIHHYYLSK